ncbi:hypothetical protein BJ170DRAFT_591330 [Xylariales sp. AK1849]|nr:hypothetical protein BJ170DRAFT_591330 [Xylariales sp. AK1849]
MSLFVLTLGTYALPMVEQLTSPNPAHIAKRQMYSLNCGSLTIMCRRDYETFCNTTNGRLYTSYTALCGYPNCDCVTNTCPRYQCGDEEETQGGNEEDKMTDGNVEDNATEVPADIGAGV